MQNTISSRMPDRYQRLDALRGVALLWMASFHFCFDLSYYQLLQADFYNDPWWTTQRTCILSTFLCCAGAAQAIALHQEQSWRRFWRRWAQIAGCALLVSVGSWLMFPDSYIYFGVLHGMALMVLLSRALGLRLALGGPNPRYLTLVLGLGLLCLVLPSLVRSPLFDSRMSNWVGLVTHKPITEDYVPLLPWWGVMLIGLLSTERLLARHGGALRGPVPRLLRPVSFLGRWSLSFYMLHQPILLGLLNGYLWLRRP